MSELQKYITKNVPILRIQSMTQEQLEEKQILAPITRIS